MTMKLPLCLINWILLAVFCQPCFAEDDTINFYTWRYADGAVWNEINRLNLLPGIQVKTTMINREYYTNTMNLLLQSGEADLFLWFSGAKNLQPLIEEDFIEPYWEALSNMNDSAMAAGKGIDGKSYGVPFAVHLQSIMVNQKLLAKHGINIAPKTLDELDDVFLTLKERGVTPIFLAAEADWYVSQVMGEVLVAGTVDPNYAQDLVHGKACFNSPEYTQIFEILKRWLDAGFLNQNVTQGDYFEMFTSVATGSAAMSFDGGWMTSKSEQYYIKDPDYKFGFWPVPGTVSKYYVHGDGTFQAGKSTKNYKQAKRVLEFTATKAFAELFAEHAQQLPAYKGDLDIKAGDLAVMAKLISENAYPVSLFSAYELNKGSPSYNTLLIEAVGSVLKKQNSPAEAGEFIQQGINTWSEPHQQTCQN